MDTSGAPAHATFPFEAEIGRRAAASGVDLSGEALVALAGHARAVLSSDDRLHLTTLRDPAEFVQRHIGESLEGARLLDPTAGGVVLDLGSGNGYPGIPLAAARPQLRAVLAESSSRKAGFLRAVIARFDLQRVEVFEGQVQRAADIAGVEPLTVLGSRAMGGWAKIIPRLAPALAPDGRVLLWAGAEVENIARRTAWKKLAMVARHPLPGRERSWVWVFRRA